jgi:hypothetical protein
MTLRNFSTAFVTMCLLAGASNAQLMGSVVDADWHYPSFGTTIETHTVTVGPGVELTEPMIANSGNLNIDFGDNWVEFRFESATTWTNASFNGWLFRDSLGVLPQVRGYTVDSFSSGIGNANAIVTGFNDDEFWADLGSMTVAAAGDWIRFSVDISNPGVSFCSGDGIESGCPCGNIGSTGEGCSNSTLKGAILEPTGSGIASANDTVLLGTQLPPNVPALFFSGVNVITPPVFFGDGLRCAGGQITRIEVVIADANGDVATSVGVASTLGASTGTQSVLQIWYRDPASLCGTNFNTSNAIDLTWL